MSDGQPPTAVWLAENGIGAPVDYHAYGGLLARRKAEQAERDAERAEARRQAELEEARDRRLTAQYLAGVQPGAAVQRALALQNVEAEIATRQAEIDKLARRRDRLVQEGRDQDEAVSRSYTMVQGPAPRDGVEGAVQRAQEVARQVRAEARVEARLAQRSARRSASPPKDPDPAPAAPCGCGVPGCTAYPVTDTERARGRDYGEITRLVEGGRMGQAEDINGRLIYR